MDERLDATLVNDLGEIARLAGLVDDFGRTNAFPPGFMHDVQVCLDEIVSNVIRYGYEDVGRHAIGVRLHVAAGRLVIEVTDDGREFDPLRHETVLAAGHARKPGGLGIYFVRRLMDDVTYRREGGLNRLVMTKSLPAA